MMRRGSRWNFEERCHTKNHQLEGDGLCFPLAGRSDGIWAQDVHHALWEKVRFAGCKCWPLLEQNNRFVSKRLTQARIFAFVGFCWYVKNRPIQFLRIPNTQLPASSICPVLMVVSTLQEATKMPCSISYQSSAEAFALLLLGALVSRLVGSPACPAQLSMGPGPKISVKSTTLLAAQAELPWWVEWSC